MTYNGVLTMDYVTYSHRYSDTISPVDNTIKNEIQEILDKLSFAELMSRQASDNDFLRYIGKKAKVGMQYSLKNILKEAFHAHDWIPDYSILGDTCCDLTIDHYKSGVGVAVSFNHRAYIGNDLLCLQTAGVVRNVINFGVYICCTREFAKKLAWTESTTMVTFEKLKEELEKFSALVTVPVWVVGIAG